MGRYTGYVYQLKIIDKFIHEKSEHTDLTVRQGVELAKSMNITNAQTLRGWLKRYRRHTGIHIRIAARELGKALNGEDANLDLTPRKLNKAHRSRYITFGRKVQLSPFPAPSKHPDALVIPVVTYRECSYCNYRIQCEAQPVGTRLCEAFYLEDADFEINGKQLTADQYFGVRLAELIT